MKPRNKFQAQIALWSKKLPQITPAQLDWGKKHCIEHIGRKTAKGIVTCLECGKEWKSSKGTLSDTLIGDTCPHCGVSLKVITTRQRIFRQVEYLCVITTYKGHQVLRFYYMEAKHQIGEKPYYSQTEVIQRWIAPTGENTVLAMLRPMFCFRDTWRWNSNLELRTKKSLYDVTPTEVYPHQRLIPELKRSGFVGQFYGLTPFELFYALLTENRVETLIKAGQTALLKHFCRSNIRKIDEYWPSIRICIRNGYKVEDGSIWIDYIDQLIRFGKDTHNPMYVCPNDLKAQHDRYVKKCNELLKKEYLEQQRNRAIEEEVRFQELKAKFFGLAFSDGKLHVHVLESVLEHLDEGEAMHHCVYGSGYHLKPQSLILSATMEGERIETIEISLQTMKIVQSRGLQNKHTEYHGQIIELVKKNMREIKKRHDSVG